MEQRVSARKREHPRQSGEPLDTTLRRRPAVGVGVLFRQDLGHGSRGVVFQRQLPNAHALIGGRGTGRGVLVEVQAVRSVVLVDRVDCRSRRAAPGLSPDGDGSSLSPARGRGANGRRKPERDGKVVRRWRVPREVCASRRREHSSMEGAPFVEAAVFDETAVEAGSAPGEGRQGQCPVGDRRVRQGRQRLRRQLGARVRTPRPGDTAGGVVDRGTRQDRAVSRSHHASE